MGSILTRALYYSTEVDILFRPRFVTSWNGYKLLQSDNVTIKVSCFVHILTFELLLFWAPSFYINYLTFVSMFSSSSPVFIFIKFIICCWNSSKIMNEFIKKIELEVCDGCSQQEIAFCLFKISFVKGVTSCCGIPKQNHKTIILDFWWIFFHLRWLSLECKRYRSTYSNKGRFQLSVDFNGNLWSWS